MDEVKNWQNRPLEAVYPILYRDAFVVKVRDYKGRSNNGPRNAA